MTDGYGCYQTELAGLINDIIKHLIKNHKQKSLTHVRLFCLF